MVSLFFFSEIVVIIMACAALSLAFYAHLRNRSRVSRLFVMLLSSIFLCAFSSFTRDFLDSQVYGYDPYHMRGPGPFEPAVIILYMVGLALFEVSLLCFSFLTEAVSSCPFGACSRWTRRIGTAGLSACILADGVVAPLIMALYPGDLARLGGLWAAFQWGVPLSIGALTAIPTLHYIRFRPDAARRPWFLVPELEVFSLVMLVWTFVEHMTGKALGVSLASSMWMLCLVGLCLAVFRSAYRVNTSALADTFSKIDATTSAFPLTAREREIAGLLVRGYVNKDIAVKLGLSYSTVKNHVSSIYKKLSIGSRHELNRFLINSIY